MLKYTKTYNLDFNKPGKVFKNFAIIFLFIYFSSYSFPKAFAQSEEVGSGSSESYYIKRSPRPKKRPLAPFTSQKPEPRTVDKYGGSELEWLKSLPCPGGQYCPAPFRSFANDGLSFSKSCNTFIGEDGVVSANDDSVGLQIYEAMREVEAANKKVTNQSGKLTGPPSNCTFNSGIDFDRACPNFKDLTPMQKDHVWLWFWASLAQTESSCNPEKEAHGIENEALGKQEIADGLFGLEYSALVRSTNGRDPRFCPHEEIKDTKNTFYQTRCAASIMFDTHCGNKIYKSGNY
jgi:hypothetical protein